MHHVAIFIVKKGATVAAVGVVAKQVKKLIEPGVDRLVDRGIALVKNIRNR